MPRREVGSWGSTSRSASSSSESAAWAWVEAGRVHVSVEVALLRERVEQPPRKDRLHHAQLVPPQRRIVQTHVLPLRHTCSHPQPNLMCVYAVCRYMGIPLAAATGAHCSKLQSQVLPSPAPGPTVDHAMVRATSRGGTAGGWGGGLPRPRRAGGPVGRVCVERSVLLVHFGSLGLGTRTSRLSRGPHARTVGDPSSSAYATTHIIHTSTANAHVGARTRTTSAARGRGSGQKLVQHLHMLGALPNVRALGGHDASYGDAALLASVLEDHRVASLA
eukprot:CAMPEP_0173209722 /NCGR_PEP_ID=MMETSP1141-20130122/23254_1 /TAXON_ID=483371 /ORGANISM="non described non described, Strain CCMP2298" /LENGTH=275 /DNA_ID=CAMNT_0014136365 /DNA_START=251 /DNA_END=1074 /DNA_ORIENTATION=+